MAKYKPWAPYCEITDTGLRLCPKHVNRVRPFNMQVAVMETTKAIQRMMSGAAL